MAAFDEEMQRALELSAQEHMATCTELVLDSKVQMPRREMSAPCAQHWRPPCRPQDGIMLQVDTVNQFAQHWAPLIREFSAPSATCGYMVIANALALQGLLPGGASWSQQQLRELLRTLRDPKVLEPFLREAMDFVSSSRAAWIKNHAADFRAGAERRKYMSAWVANYEISDLLRSKAAQGSLSRFPVRFVRCNQWPEYGTATHEERERLLEEQCFGGFADSNGCAQYGLGDSMFLVESFVPERRLQRPEDFLLTWTEDEKPPEVPGVFILDLNGHFVTCLAVHLQTEDGAVKPSLIVINTTGSRYLDNVTCSFTFDLVYPPEVAELASVEGQKHPKHEHPLTARSSATALCDVCGSLGTAYRCAAGCDWDICTRCLGAGFGTTCASIPSADPSAVAQLVAMGFPESTVREALLATTGNLDRALELLIG